MAKYNLDAVISKYRASVRKLLDSKDNGSITSIVHCKDGGIVKVQKTEDITEKPCNNN